MDQILNSDICYLFLYVFLGTCQNAYQNLPGYKKLVQMFLTFL
jgi:hypothetical protein